MKSESLSNIYNPPGGILVWFVIMTEIFTFSIGFIAVAWLRKTETHLFIASQNQLNFNHAILMTILLIISGWAAAKAVESYFQSKHSKYVIYNLVGITLGTVFIILKLNDFAELLETGHNIEKNTFWNLYWLLSSFHLLHLILGILLLLTVSIKTVKNSIHDLNFAIRGTASFWHMCDIIWIILFPLFYS